MINTIRETLNRLGNILTNKERKKITKELYETLKKVNNTDKNRRLRKRQKERLLRKLIEQNNELVKKEQFVQNRYDDLEYQGISDIKPIYYFSIINEYYNPELIESSFDHNYERYHINGDKNKELSLNDYLNTIKENLVNLLTTKNVSEKKVQLVISTVFFNYLNDESAIKYTYSDNIEIIPTDDSNEVPTELFNSLLHSYQETLENKMEGSSFVFDYVNFLDIEFKIVDLIRASSHIPLPDWIKSKKATINPKNDDNECFKYAITVALSHNEIYNHLERISNIKKHT